MLTTLPTEVGMLVASTNSTTSSIVQNFPALGLGATIIASFSAHSPPCQWVRWSHDNHKGVGWVPQMCGWRNWCRPGISHWITSPPGILKVSASGYILHLPFVANGPLGLHDSGCTLELQLQSHWLELDLLVGEGPVAENISLLQFVMWLVAFTAQWDHAAPISILTGWLTCLLESCDGFRGWFFSRLSPHILLFSWREICCEYIRVWNSFLVIFVSMISVCLNYLDSMSLSLVCFNFSGIVRTLFLVYWPSSNFPCLLSLFLDLDRSCCTYFRFNFIFLLIPFLFLSWTPCRFFSCFIWFIPIRWHLSLVVRALVSDVCFLLI